VPKPPKPPKVTKPPKPPKEPKPPKPTKESVIKHQKIKIFKSPKPGKTKMERKRKDIEARLAYNDTRANQFRESLMRNNTLDPLVSEVQLSL
jgi:putative endonuclease